MTPTRFQGTIEPLTDVNIPHNLEPEWGVETAIALTEQFYPGCIMGGIGLFELAPGQMHPAHNDIQPPEWVVRIHIPLQTNPHCTATMNDGFHEMRVGTAYRFNTLATHAVSNAGKTPRVHLVFDIKRK